MSSETLRLLIIGAHPDDCDLSGGGTAALYRQHGHTVRFVSVTNGESGHHLKSGQELAAIRRAEAAAAGAVCGITYDVLNNRDGRLQPTIEARDVRVEIGTGAVAIEQHARGAFEIASLGRGVACALHEGEQYGPTRGARERGGECLVSRGNQMRSRVGREGE